MKLNLINHNSLFGTEYMIINVYVPSFFTMIMTTLLLYLRAESHFATAITLVLTSILCFFTLLQSSISHIPKTSYLKFIDYWNILVVTVTLSNFFTLAFWELGDQNHSAIIWRQIKQWMRIVIPLVTLRIPTASCHITYTYAELSTQTFAKRLTSCLMYV